MIVSATVSRDMLLDTWRLDAKHYVDAGSRARLRVLHGPWRRSRVDELIKPEGVWMPGREGRVYASDPTFGKPFLTPSDTLRFMPSSSSILSRLQTKAFGQYEVTEGQILITRSGRNLGPSVMVDKYMEQFAVSDDMVRIDPMDDDLSFYVMAFLQTQTGQEIIRLGKNGSVVDHINPKQIQGLVVPILDESVVAKCVKDFKLAKTLRDKSRLSLQAAAESFLELTGLKEAIANLPSAAFRRHFALNKSDLADWRIDAEPHIPIYRECRQCITSLGLSVQVHQLAKVERPPSRYRRIYIEDARYGSWHLSGRHVSQMRPVALKLISPLSFTDPTLYEIKAGTVLMTGDGRAEERLADCAIVGKQRDGWYASGHILRLLPREGVNSGLLYLSCTSSIVQEQIKALAVGSVVDALIDDDIRALRIPYPTSEEAMELGDSVIEAWNSLEEAIAIEDATAALLQAELVDRPTDQPTLSRRS